MNIHDLNCTATVAKKSLFLVLRPFKSTLNLKNNLWHFAHCSLSFHLKKFEKLLKSTSIKQVATINDVERFQGHTQPFYFELKIKMIINFNFFV